MNPLRSPLIILLALLLFGPLGCGQNSGPRRYEVSGKVSYRGEPVRFGYMYLEPDPLAGNSGPGSMAKIIDGAYRTDPGRGVVGGSYRVRISGLGPPAEDLGDGKPLFPEKLYIVDLPQKASLQDFDVSDSDTNAAAPKKR